MSKKNKTSIYLFPEDREKIESRGQLSTVIRRDLDRLYSLYQRELSRVSLTVDEACLIVDCLNGSIMDVRSASMLWASVENSIQLDKLDEKWNVDGSALVEKLKELNLTQCLAIVDASERFWNAEERSIPKTVKACFGI